MNISNSQCITQENERLCFIDRKIFRCIGTSSKDIVTFCIFLTHVIKPHAEPSEQIDSHAERKGER